MANVGCSFPGCERHPSKGDYGGDSGPDLARQYEKAARGGVSPSGKERGE